jgi:integrase
LASTELRQTTTGPRWRVVWTQDGARQQATYRTEKAAADFRAKVEAYGNRWPPGEDPRVRPAHGGTTFAEWADIAIGRRTRASERTRADYRRDLERHFRVLADVPLAALSEDHVIGWLGERRAAGLADKTIRNLHGFASSLIADALSQHPPLVTHNPFTNRLTERAAVRTEEMVFFTPPEFELILRRVPDERHYPELIRLLYGTGLRYGEATALQVRDVQLFGKRKTLTVTKAWKRTGPASWEVGEPKTPRSRRTLSLSPELVDMLIPLVAARNGDELLFGDTTGGRLPHIEVWKRAWAPAVARANVCDEHYAPQRDGRGKPPRLPKPCDCPGVLGKAPRIHDNRHSHVAALLGDGVSIAVISRRLGHSSITITMDRYGHLDPALDAQVDAAVDRALARR